MSITLNPNPTPAVSQPATKNNQLIQYKTKTNFPSNNIQRLIGSYAYVSDSAIILAESLT